MLLVIGVSRLGIEHLQEVGDDPGAVTEGCQVAAERQLRAHALGVGPAEAREDSPRPILDLRAIGVGICDSLTTRTSRKDSPRQDDEKVAEPCLLDHVETGRIGHPSIALISE